MLIRKCSLDLRTEPRESIHMGGELIDTAEGVRLACPRCKKLLDAEQWAEPCVPTAEAT